MIAYFLSFFLFSVQSLLWKREQFQDSTFLAGDDYRAKRVIHIF